MTLEIRCMRIRTGGGYAITEWRERNGRSSSVRLERLVGLGSGHDDGSGTGCVDCLFFVSPFRKRSTQEQSDSESGVDCSDRNAGTCYCHHAMDLVTPAHKESSVVD